MKISLIHKGLVAFSLLFAITPAISGQIEDSVTQAVKAALPQGQERADILVEGTDQLGDCRSPAASLPYAIPERGGRVSVAVSCAGEPVKYIRAQVKLTVRYVQVTQEVNRGDVLTRDMLSLASSDRAAMPNNVITDVESAIGQEATRRIKPGGYIQASALRKVKVIARNARVTVIAAGKGFSVRHDGIALDDGGLGAQIRVRLVGGEIIKGSVAEKNVVKISI
jgi:flagella basal body P-ring formation protein FlgA